MPARNMFMFSARGLFLQVLAAIGWSLITVKFYGIDFWGEIVDYLLFAQIFTIVVDWGCRRYMAGKIQYELPQFNHLLGLSIMSRLPILLLAMFFLLTAPFTIYIRLAMCAWIIGKWLQQGFETSLVRQNKHNYISAGDIMSILVTLGTMGYFNKALTPERMIIALGAGQLAKGLVLLCLVKQWSLFFRWSNIRLDFLVRSFPFFLLVFSNLLHFTIDRYFVYTRADNEIKGEYQVYVALLLILVYLVTYVLYPSMASVMDIEKLTQRRSIFALSIAGIVVVPFWTWLSIQFLEHVYSVTPDPQLMLFGILYILPYFMYYPMYHALMVKRKYTYLIISHFSAALINLIFCIYLVNSYNIMTALLAAGISNFSMMALLFIFTIIDRMNVPRQVEYV